MFEKRLDPLTQFWVLSLWFRFVFDILWFSFVFDLRGLVLCSTSVVQFWQAPLPFACFLLLYSTRHDIVQNLQTYFIQKYVIWTEDPQSHTKNVFIGIEFFYSSHLTAIFEEEEKYVEGKKSCLRWRYLSSSVLGFLCVWGQTLGPGSHHVRCASRVTWQKDQFHAGYVTRCVTAHVMGSLRHTRDATRSDACVRLEARFTLGASCAVRGKATVDIWLTQRSKIYCDATHSALCTLKHAEDAAPCQVSRLQLIAWVRKTLCVRSSSCAHQKVVLHGDAIRTASDAARFDFVPFGRSMT